VRAYQDWDDSYCPTSVHHGKLHGVLSRDRRIGPGEWVLGRCCYCKREVVGHMHNETPWQAERYVIEEEPV
jgi:hypothetical protein